MQPVRRTAQDGAAECAATQPGAGMRAAVGSGVEANVHVEQQQAVTVDPHELAAAGGQIRQPRHRSP